MKRREFVAAGAALVLTGLTVRAQQGRMPTVGILLLGTPPPETLLGPLSGALQVLGHVEGRNVKFDIRNAGGRSERLAGLASELVARKVDLILAFQTPPAVAAKQATSDLPIVFSSVGDPLATGLVGSFARPGGNATGTTAGTAEVSGKTVELIREVLPSARNFAVLANETDPFTPSYLEVLGRGATKIGLEMRPVMVHPASRLDWAFESMVAGQAEAVVIQGSLVSNAAAELAKKHRLPSFASPQQFPRLGGLMSYAVNFQAMMQDTAGYIDKILSGAKPADLPVSFPTQFQLTVNLQTARAIGVQIPRLLLVRADEVIE